MGWLTLPADAVRVDPVISEPENIEVVLQPETARPKTIVATIAVEDFSRGSTTRIRIGALILSYSLQPSMGR
jgi:hypothetical protein